ncbi:MAG: hypothetical protein ACMUIP_05510 [bacterium]
MNKAAIKKHEIYNNLSGLTERELLNIADYIDFIRYKQRLGEKKIIKLGGILKDCDIDFSDLKEFREKTWKHVEEETASG